MLNERDYMQPWRRTQSMSDIEAQAIFTRAVMERRKRAVWPWGGSMMATVNGTPSNSNGVPALSDEQLLDDIARTCGTDAVGAIVVMRKWREAGGYRHDTGTLGQRRLEFARWLREHGKIGEGVSDGR